MSATCPCPYCNTHIEFEADQTGQVAACPHCGRDVILATVRPARIRTEPQITVREALLDRTQYSNERTIVNWTCGLTTVGAGIGLLMLLGAVLNNSVPVDIDLIFVCIIAALLSAWVAWGIAHAIFDIADCALRRFSLDDVDEEENQDSN
jgi:DNA-directed RNA polymerase subunit RPC12/RpoP